MSGGRVWFSSDAHFGHRLVAGLRGFATCEAHDKTLIENFAAVVHPEDQVWWLGDMTISRPEPAFEALAQIPGRHHLVLGNHDKASPVFRDGFKWQRAYLEHFVSVSAYARRRIAGRTVLLSHYPYATDDGQADRGEVRYLQHRLPDCGDWLLHGHTHLGDQRVHGRQIHVGVDAWGLSPVPLDRIAQIIEEAS